MDIALRIAYDGGRFDSYARQPGRRTVEGELGEALGHEGLEEGGLRTGSRTDAGVSALCNVLRARLRRPHLRGLLPAVQAHLPPGLWVTGAAVAPEGFDPRRAAWRQYAYVHPQGGEDSAAMLQAAQAFVGRHGMHAFARLDAGRDPKRTILAFEIEGGDGWWTLRVRGESFLWNQVRRMAGAILAVGRGKAPVDSVAASLASGKPHPRFELAPAEGLILERVEYPGLEWDPVAGPRSVRARDRMAALAGHRVAEAAGLPGRGLR